MKKRKRGKDEKRKRGKDEKKKRGKDEKRKRGNHGAFLWLIARWEPVTHLAVNHRNAP